MTNESNHDAVTTLRQMAVLAQQLFLLDMIRILLKTILQGDVNIRIFCIDLKTSYTCKTCYIGKLAVKIAIFLVNIWRNIFKVTFTILKDKSSTFALLKMRPRISELPFSKIVSARLDERDCKTLNSVVSKSAMTQGEYLRRLIREHLLTIEKPPVAM